MNDVFSATYKIWPYVCYLCDVMWCDVLLSLRTVPYAILFSLLLYGIVFRFNRHSVCHYCIKCPHHFPWFHNGCPRVLSGCLLSLVVIYEGTVVDRTGSIGCELTTDPNLPGKRSEYPWSMTSHLVWDLSQHGEGSHTVIGTRGCLLTGCLLVILTLRDWCGLFSPIS